MGRLCSGASGQFSYRYANSLCWWVAVGMGQNMVSFAPITLGRTMSLLFCEVQLSPLPRVP